MRKGKKIAVAATAAALMVSAGAFAAGTARNIQAYFGNVKLYVDGKAVKEETLTYNGVTYVPLRAAAETLGMEVNYDEKSAAVYLSSQGNSASEYSADNPAPIGTAQTITVEGILSDYKAEVKVTEIVRGAEATKMIKSANIFNADPKQGYEYVLAKIYMKVTESEDDKKVSISSSSFGCYSESGAEYKEFVVVVEPEPKLSSSFLPGASAEGWVSFMVKSEDAAPKMCFGAKYDGSGGAWFKLY